MAWLYIAVAGLLEAAWPTLVGRYQHLVWMPLAIALTFAVPTLYLLGLATRSLSMPTVYFVFIAIGSVGNVLAAMLVTGKLGDPVRLIPIALIVVGIAWLQAYREG
jgi:quaternary ammonium compound-resistance protein SugE